MCAYESHSCFSLDRGGGSLYPSSGIKGEINCRSCGAPATIPLQAQHAQAPVYPVTPHPPSKSPV